MILCCKYAKREKGGCTARVRKSLLTGTYRRDGKPHNHPPESDEQKLVEAVNAITAESATSRERPREIFDRVRRR